MIKIVHTADIHLGREFPILRKRGKEYRRQLLKTFEQIIKFAIDQQVSVVLIAGDLFDTNRVHGDVVGTVLSEFKKLEEANIRVCICPGTHDAYNDESIYRFVGFPSNVTVLTPDHDHEIFEDLDLTVYGKAFDGKLVGKSPLQGLSLVEESKFHVGIAHCSIRREGWIEKDSMILDIKEIAASRLDYLALGHWHSFQNFSQGDTKAYYCGSPEPIYMDQKGAGNVVIINIYEKGNIEVNPVRVGSKQFDELTIDVGLVKSMNDIAETIKNKANPDLILKVTLQGLTSMHCDINAQGIEEELSDRFFGLRILDKSHPKLEEVKAEDFPEQTVIGRFVRILEEKIAEANKEEKVLYGEALKLGFALLEGRSQVIE